VKFFKKLPKSNELVKEYYIIRNYESIELDKLISILSKFKKSRLSNPKIHIQFDNFDGEYFHGASLVLIGLQETGEIEC